MIMANCKMQSCACANDYLVCTCMGVMASEICKSIETGSTTFQALSEDLMVGTGCSSCVDEVKQILEYKMNQKSKNDKN